MNIEQEIRDSVLILKIIGRLDSASSPELERVLCEHFDAGVTRVILDLSALGYTSSAGLRVVLLAGKKLRPIKGRLVLAGMQEPVHEIFEMSGFLTLFDFADTVDQAVGKIQ